jgi:hypothetical protein
MVRIINLAESDKKECPPHGTFVNSFSTVVSEDCDCYANGKILFKFRKNVIAKEDADIALKNFLKHAKKVNDNRGIAAGVFEDGNAKKKVNNFSRGNKAASNIIGYFDKPILQQKGELKKKYGKVPHTVCRKTAFNANHQELFDEANNFFRTIDNHYKDMAPDHYQSQFDFSKKILPEFVINRTTFTTVTCNHNWQTAIHTDKGDYPDGLGNLTVVGTDDYEGGYLGFPEWDIGVDLRATDVIIADVHQPHCNTPMVKKSPKSVRLSFVCYLRTDMAKCTKYYKDDMYVSEVK